MNYFAKTENGISTQDPLSDKERTMGIELEAYLSKTFSHIPIGGSKKILPSGHTLNRTASQWSLEKGDTEIKIEQGTGIPRVRKVCNTIRKEGSSCFLCLEIQGEVYGKICRKTKIPPPS